MVIPNQQAIVDAGKMIYERRRLQLEATSQGQFASIDVSSHQLFVAPSADEALRNAQASGQGPFFIVRIGSRAAYRMRRTPHGGDTRIVR
jgi:hypothetical protein